MSIEEPKIEGGTNDKGEPQGEEGTQKINIVEEAKKVNEELKANIALNKQLMEQVDQARAEKLLSGTTDAGQEPEKPKEETPKEYKDRVLRGEV